MVQGAVGGEAARKCLNSIRKHLPGAEIILSTWQGSDITGLDYDVLVLSKDPGAKYFNTGYSVLNNGNRQIVSSSAGMKKATRKYILRFRTDFVLESNEFLRYWDAYPKRRAEYALFSHRVLADVLFSRFCAHTTGIPTPFHISDFWMFGLADDVKEYYCSAPILKENELGEYDFVHPERVPYPDMTFKFPLEQHFCYSYVKSKIPELELRDWSDWNSTNIDLANNIIFNNFVLLSHDQSGIWSDKHAWSILTEDYVHGIINHYYFQDRYKFYCDPSYTPRRLRKTDENPFADMLRVLREPVKFLYRCARRVYDWARAVVSLLYRAIKKKTLAILRSVGHKSVLKTPE